MNYSNVIGIEYFFEKSSDIWTVFEFKGLNLPAYYFEVIDEIIVSEKGWAHLCKTFKADYFQKINGASLAVQCLVLHLYPEGVSVEKIDTYEDFKKSNCEMILLLYDSYYLEIYAKKPLWIQKLYENAKQLPEVKVELKYLETDGRTGMYV